MLTKRLSWLLLLAVSLWLSGCATSRSNTPLTAIAPASSAAQKLGDARPGDIVDLPAGNKFGETTIVVGDDYTAASGRLCRRLRSSEGAVLSRIVCKSEAGQWYSPRSLYSNKVKTAQQLFDTPSKTSAQTTENQTQSIVAVELGEDDLQTKESKVRTANADIETEKHLLKLGETLWSFSRRVTGNALNWNTIADLNNIDDSRRLAAGDTLLVPKSLVRGEP